MVLCSAEEEKVPEVTETTEETPAEASADAPAEVNHPHPGLGVPAVRDRIRRVHARFDHRRLQLFFIT